MKQVFLSRRNLLALLSKLDRAAAGEQTKCSIIKYKNPDDPQEYQQDISELLVTAVEETSMLEINVVEDADFYKARSAGMMLPQDTPPIQHMTGESENSDESQIRAYKSLMNFFPPKH